MSIRGLSHVYSPKTPFECSAISDINLDIFPGETLGVIGHTGSGKSTLISHLNGLIKPSSGSILFNGEDIYQSKEFTRKLRFKVGLVMQYPEYQLFEETVYKDIAFGPQNMGLSKETTKRYLQCPLQRSTPCSLPRLSARAGPGRRFWG